AVVSEGDERGAERRLSRTAPSRHHDLAAVAGRVAVDGPCAADNLDDLGVGHAVAQAGQRIFVGPADAALAGAADAARQGEQGYRCCVKSHATFSRLNDVAGDAVRAPRTRRPGKAPLNAPSR